MNNNNNYNKIIREIYGCWNNYSTDISVISYILPLRTNLFFYDLSFFYFIFFLSHYFIISFHLLLDHLFISYCLITLYFCIPFFYYLLIQCFIPLSLTSYTCIYSHTNSISLFFSLFYIAFLFVIYLCFPFLYL